MQDDNDKWVSWTKDLFVFFAASQFKNAFREHLHYLVAQCKISPACLLSKFFTEEGAFHLFPAVWLLLHKFKQTISINMLLYQMEHLQFVLQMLLCC